MHQFSSFQASLASELYNRGLKVTYEYDAGVDDTTIDFMSCDGEYTWLVELVSIGTSDACKKATNEKSIGNNILAETTLLHTWQRNHYADNEMGAKIWNEERKQSEEGEMLLVNRAP